MTMLDSMIIEFDVKKHSLKQLFIHEFEIDIHDQNKIYWVHCNLNQQEEFNTIIEKLSLPDEVVKLCKQQDSIPKLMDNDEELTIQIQCLLSTELKRNEADFNNLVIHLTSRFCFTAAYEALPPLLEFIATYKKSIRYAKTPCFILFLILDNAINDYARILYNFELITEQMDMRVRTTHRNIYNKVMRIKQQLMKVKHYTIAVREILMRISNRNITVISEECRSSLYNLSNHSHMVVHEIDSIRDMLNGLLDQIDNALIQKLSETMKVLTAFAAIFLPLTLITGIYGMNFHWIPELQWKYGYFWALSLIIVIGIALFFIFKKMRWI